MNNDLISRKALLRALNKWDISKLYLVDSFKELVDGQPTAYDPNKVAKEVREVASRIFNYCEEIDLHIPEEERTGYEMLPDIWKLSEIVKKGGSDE